MGFEPQTGGRPRIYRCVGFTYHQMSEKHVRRYVAEFAGRYNIRKRDRIAQMDRIARGLGGKRPKYAELVA